MLQVENATNDNSSYLFPIKKEPAPHNTVLLIGDVIHDGRSSIRKIKDLFRLIWHEIRFQCTYMPSRLKDLFHTNPNYSYPLPSNNSWKKDSEGLYIFIHGLKGHPSQWNKQAQSIRMRHPQADVRQVYVSKHGDCSLETAADPIIAMARDYITKHPSNPVYFTGISNGGRVAFHAANELKNSSTPIKVDCVAGVLFGSKIMNQFVSKTPILRSSYSQEIRNEIAHGSEKAKEILNAQQNLPPTLIRDYEFYAATEDLFVWSYNSCLPKVSGAQYHIYTAEGHSSILNRIHNKQVDSAYSWMQRHKP